MNELIIFLVLHLSTMGVTILVVWPVAGPTAWIRETILRRVLPFGLSDSLDCYVCLSFWIGLAKGASWWLVTGYVWCFSAFLTTPALFWIVLQLSSQESDDNYGQ